MKALLDAGADLERPAEEAPLVHVVQLRPAGRGLHGRDAVLAGRLRAGHPGHEAPRGARRRPEHPDHEAAGAAGGSAAEEAGGGDEQEEADPSGLPPVPVGGPGRLPDPRRLGRRLRRRRCAGNAHRHVPDGWLPAVKYLVEELGADVNARDSDGYTPLHHAAARGDNELIQYLVEGRRRDAREPRGARPRSTWPTARSSGCSPSPRRSRCSRAWARRTTTSA